MKKRPNILLIVTDQQRGDCLGITNNELLTPNMDNIALEGARFENCYTTCPQCEPARRSLMSGQFPSTHGIFANVGRNEWNEPSTLPSVLKTAGYHTYLVGRSMHTHPFRKRYGFDHMVLGLRSDSPTGVSSQDTDYGRFLKYNTKYHDCADYFQGGVMHNDWTARPWHLDEALHFTNWTIDQALNFLQDRDPSSPYFLAVTLLAPHPPLTPPSFYLERYLRMDLSKPHIGTWETPPENEGKGIAVDSHRVNLTGEAFKSCKAAYYGLINHIDDQLRRLINPTTGDRAVNVNDTIVIFTSDHGEMLGDHYCWSKRLPYEGSANIPLLIRAPKNIGIKNNNIINEAVCLEDIMPTVLDMAGVKVPDTVEGKSLYPLLRGEKTRLRKYVHIENAPNFHCLTDGMEKYIWFTGSGKEQFFNLREDPNECNDLINEGKAAERVSYWKEILIDELKGRPEGFSDGSDLIAGRDYPALLNRER